MVKVLFTILIFALGVQSTPLKDTKDSSNIIGCVKCHDVDQNKINVHLIPHSHDDVGWQKTVDQYYYGAKNNIRQASVQYIITSVVEALSENEDRRFIQVETAFFWKWWNLQTDDMRNQFKSLVDNGQIEMVNGGWVMNDEACANYQSIIDQFTWGLRAINDTIGTCGIPRVGWQIDPFGHSREQASLFAQLGYDGVFFSRLDYVDKFERKQNGALDFAWQGSANLDNSIIFGGIFPTDIYYSPNAFCWDYTCSDDPVNDNPNSVDYNVDVLVEKFTNMSKEFAKYYPSKNLIIPMGGDFHYEAAEMNFINMDRLIKAFKDHPDINLIYSTPSCYIKAVNDAQPKLKLKTDDFFPYSNDEHAFWTGYYTSRPNSKRFERTGHNILQAAKQLLALSGISSGANYQNNVMSLKRLREVMGVMQHHDAVTGTEMQHVTNDYVRQLTQAIEKAEQPLGDIVRDLLSTDKSEQDINLKLSSCLLANVSICNITRLSDAFVVVVHNPLSWPVTHYVRLPVNSTNFTIQGPDGEEDYDVVDPIPYFATELAELQGPYELVFAARDVPPLGLKMYYVNESYSPASDKIKSTVIDDGLTFGDNETNFKIDATTNLIESVTMNGITLDFSQNFYYYFGADDKMSHSGAYLFRPTEREPESPGNEVQNFAIVRGKLVDEFHQKWSYEQVNISQIIRVYKNEKYIEFDWLVGGINITNDRGKEIVTRYTVKDFNNNSTFYTDSNGREMMKRQLNFRPDYTYNSTEPVSSNYYPVSSKIVIKDASKDIEVAILTDRSQGGSSLEDGLIELMVHRRLLVDDSEGVGECLNETEFNNGVYVRGSHYLVVGSSTKANSDGRTTAAQERILAQKKLLQPWIGLANATSLAYDDIKKKFNFGYSILTEALPENINILTFEPWSNDSNDTYLLRLEHLLEKEEDPVLSNTTTIYIGNMFENFGIAEINETTLGANQWLKDYQKQARYKWNITGDQMDVVAADVNYTLDDLTLTLTPMQIRTFVVKLKPRASFGLVAKPLSVMMLLSVLVYILN